MKVYFISGLAADSSMFKYIRLPEGFTMVHLDWLDPIGNETLDHYAWRLGQGIDHSEPFAVVGLSLGGMFAAEIARQYFPARTILISSVPCYNHLPGYFRVLGRLGLHKIVPPSWLKAGALFKRRFTSEHPDDKILLSAAIRNSDSGFIRWSMNAVLHWKKNPPPENYIHIHGGRDEVLPIFFTKPTHRVKGGSHLMVFTRAAEINRILEEVLSSQSMTGA